MYVAYREADHLRALYGRGAVKMEIIGNQFVAAWDQIRGSAPSLSSWCCT